MAVDPGKAAAARLRRMAGPETVRQIGAALKAGAGLIEVEAALLIEAGSVSGKGHVPSKPGEPPNSDTQLLARSIESALVEPLKAEVTANARYAKPLEYGTSRMAARPFFGPAFEKHHEEVRDMIRAAMHVFAKDRIVGAQPVETAEDYAARIGSALAAALDRHTIALDTGKATIRWAGSQLLMDPNEPGCFHSVQNFRVRAITE